MPISWNSDFQISLDFCDRWVKNCVGTNLPYGVLWKLIDPCFFCCHGSMGFHKTPYRRFVPTQFSLIGRKNSAKFENDSISKNRHWIKMTQPNLMILVSFSSAEDALSNDVNKHNTRYWKSAVPLFGDTRYKLPRKSFPNVLVSWDSKDRQHA